ncbi:hypothetical protein VTK26DRAFT_6551 [Humicola hyalothermophila]
MKLPATAVPLANQACASTVYHEPGTAITLDPAFSNHQTEARQKGVMNPDVHNCQRPLASNVCCFAPSCRQDIDQLGKLADPSSGRAPRKPQPKSATNSVPKPAPSNTHPSTSRVPVICSQADPPVIQAQCELAEPGLDRAKNLEVPWMTGRRPVHPPRKENQNEKSLRPLLTSPQAIPGAINAECWNERNENCKTQNQKKKRNRRGWLSVACCERRGWPTSYDAEPEKRPL